MRCPHCNGKVDRIDKFCGNCGRSVVGVVEETEPSAESAAAPRTRAFASSRDDSQTWGARLNAYGTTYGSGRAHPSACPAWVDRRDWHYWDSHGLVVWDNVGHGIGVLHASHALQLLEQLMGSDDWKTEGIPISEHSVRLSLDDPKQQTGRRKKQPRDLAVKSLAEPTGKQEDHWEERLRLKGQAAEEFRDFLRRNEAQLRQVADSDQKRVNHAVMTFWGMMFKNHFVKQLQSVELAGRPLPWTRVEEPPELICDVPPDKGRIVVHKEGFWWESSIEAPDEVPVFGPFAMEVAQAMEWVEQTLPKHRADLVAQQQARAAEEAAEAARMAALRGKNLKRYWIDASDLEPERITYRAVIHLEYVPFHVKKMELLSGKVIDTDKEFYTPTMLAQQIGLDAAHVDVEQPLDFLGWYWVRSATTYHQADVAASQAQHLWDQSRVLDRLREKKLIRAQYGYEEVETRYVMWLGECATPDNSWGPSQARSGIWRNGHWWRRWWLRWTSTAGASY